MNAIKSIVTQALPSTPPLLQVLPHSADRIIDSGAVCNVSYYHHG